MCIQNRVYNSGVPTCRGVLMTRAGETIYARSSLPRLAWKRTEGIMEKSLMMEWMDRERLL